MIDGLEPLSIEWRDTFLTVAAHELKTSLTSVQDTHSSCRVRLNQGFGLGAAHSRKSGHLIEDRTRPPADDPFPANGRSQFRRG